MSSSGGVGFCGLLTILFIGLKLTGHITWSWAWVLSPLWLTVAIALALVLLVLLIQLPFKLVAKARRIKCDPRDET